MREDALFAQSMLGTKWAYRGRRSWTTLTSFGLQTAIIGLLLLVPLLTTVSLPSNHVLQPPVSWGAPPPPLRSIEHQHVTTLIQSNLANNELIAPPSVPPHVAMIDETEAPPQVTYSNSPGVEGGTGDGSGEGVWKSINDALSHPAPVAAPPKRDVPVFRTSRMLEGSLIRRVQPIYPSLARTARIQGAVVLAATISKAGTMENVRLVSGHPMLVPAAVDAVSQWRYKPYVLNGDAVEVETQITVNFVLSGNY